MKCIHCGSDSKLKDRKTNGGRCTGCSHRFAFEPTTDKRKVTDGLFLRCIEDVSGAGTLFFTEKQLWYEMNRRLLRKFPQIPPGFGIGAVTCAAGGVLGIVSGFAFLLPVGLLAAIGAIVAGGIVGKKNRRPRRVIVSLDEFRRQYLEPYRSTHGPVQKLLAPPTDARPSRRQTIPLEVPPDLASYSFDRALVTEHADIAAMLVANRFHFENNCAIVSIDGRYPEEGRFERILQMLRQNPNLTVFGIHDAGSDGLRLPLTLRAENWFPERTVRVVDLGLRPLQVLKGGFLLTVGTPPSALPPEIASRLTPEEVTWLQQGDVAEIASLRPARLMRAIFQGFNQANALPVGAEGGANGVIFVGGPGSGGDVWADNGAGGDVFAADSFG